MHVRNPWSACLNDGQIVYTHPTEPYQIRFCPGARTGDIYKLDGAENRCIDLVQVVDWDGETGTPVGDYRPVVALHEWVAEHGDEPWTKG